MLQCAGHHHPHPELDEQDLDVPHHPHPELDVPHHPHPELDVSPHPHPVPQSQLLHHVGVSLSGHHSQYDVILPQAQQLYDALFKPQAALVT